MNKSKHKGMTMVEVMIAAAMLFMIALGGMSYQYHAVKQKKMSWADLTATRTGIMILEDWKSTGGKMLGGENGYDLAEFDDDFIQINDGTWKTKREDLPMKIYLRSDDVETNEISGVTLKQLSVTVRWRADFADGRMNPNSPSIKLRTYTRTDLEGG